MHEWQLRAVRHHQPITIPVTADPSTTENPGVALTRDIGRRLTAIVFADPDHMIFQQFGFDAPAVTEGWKRHQIGIAGHTVVMLGTPDLYVPRLTTYVVEVNGEPAPYRFTYERPLAALLAEAAGRVLTARDATA